MPHIGNFPERGHPKPLSVPPAAFVPGQDTYDWLITNGRVGHRAALVTQIYLAPVFLPQDSRVTKLTLFGYREDALSTLILRLHRVDDAGTVEEMALITADWTTGRSSGYDDTIVNPVIDNENYAYNLEVTMLMNDAVGDCYFARALIDWQ